MIILFILQTFSIGIGSISLDKKINATTVNFNYFIDISKEFFIHQNIEYWQKTLKKEEGIVSQEQNLSSIAFREGLYLRLWKIYLGPVIGINLMKNGIKEKISSAHWIITEYYYINSSPISLHIEMGGSIKIYKIFLSPHIRLGIIFLDKGEKNLLSSYGDVKEFAYSVNFNL